MTSQSSSRDPLCEAAARFMDSCVKSGPSPEAGAEVLRHIQECPDCARESALRSRVTERLKAAVQGQPEAGGLETEIRRSVRRQRRRTPGPQLWMWRLAATAAVVVACIGGLASYHFGHLRFTAESQDAYIADISAGVARILQVGLRDHVHCAVFQKLPQQPPSAATMVADLGPEYGELASLVQARVPGEYVVVTGHRCSYRGRQYVHLVLRGGSQVLSLVIARKTPGESFERDGLAPVLAETGVPIYKGGIQRFAIAGFETREHLVYLVSDLGGQQNLSLLASLAQPVRMLLTKLEG